MHNTWSEKILVLSQGKTGNFEFSFVWQGWKHLSHVSLDHVDVKSHFLIQTQCYYVGGTEDAATGMLGDITKPLSFHVPPEKVCEKLKRKDSQICELQYGKKEPSSSMSYFCFQKHTFTTSSKYIELCLCRAYSWNDISF